jgi:hypothetical protein
MGRRAPVPAAGHHRHPDDRGGVWIATGIVLGAVVYAGCVLMAVAGFSAVVPLVVVPPVLLGIIAANSLLGGGRDHQPSRGRRQVHGQAPLSSSGGNGALEPGVSSPPGQNPPSEEPTGHP